MNKLPIYFCIGIILAISTFECDSAILQMKSSSVKVQPNANWCLGCLCEAASHCNRHLKCDGAVCGLFQITYPYWVDAGKLTVKSEDSNDRTAYINCANDQDCAATTVSSYLTRYSQDCNGDGIIDCYDYAAIHFHGGYSCSRPLTGNYYDTYAACEKHWSSLQANETVSHNFSPQKFV